MQAEWLRPWASHGTGSQFPASVWCGVAYLESTRDHVRVDPCKANALVWAKHWAGAHSKVILTCTACKASNLCPHGRYHALQAVKIELVGGILVDTQSDRLGTQATGSPAPTHILNMQAFLQARAAGHWAAGRWAHLDL